MKSIQSPSTPPLSHSQYSYTPTSSPSRPAAPTSPLIAMIPSLDTESPPPVDDELHQEVDILHRFRNPELQQHYQHFLKRSPKPIKVIFGLNFILTCYFLPISIQYFAHTIRNNTHSWHESADCVLGLSYLLTILLSAVLGWMLLASYRTKCSIVLPVLFKPEANFAIPPSSMPRSNSTNLLDMPISTSSPSEATCKTLQTTPLMYMYVLCLTTSAVLNFIHDALPAHHKHPHFLLLEHSLKGSDHDHMLLLRDCLLMTILPFLFVQFFLDLSLLFHYILVCSIAVLIIAMDVAQDYYIPILYVILWTVAALCIVKDNHFRTLQHFYTTMKLSTASHQDAHQSVAETKETDDLLSRQQQLAIVETKKMIANVAHDLKTPLSSFMVGIDNIEQQILFINQQIIEEHPPAKAVAAAKIANSMESLRYCLAHIRNSHHFMLMAINRCIDSTKASSGLKLVPKYETIHLERTLDLPLHITQFLQQHIDIYLLPIDPDICTHIITDQQWLQENILCLLSNAIKYSNGGVITLSAHLEHSTGSEDFLKKRRRSTITNPSQMLTARCSTSDSVELDIEASNDILQENDWESSEADLRETFLCVEVEDTGIGMTEEAMATLFSPFKQTQRLAGGTGLGLYSLAKRLDSLGGTYGVTNRRDGQQGSLFWFAFPYRPDDGVSALTMSDCHQACQQCQLNYKENDVEEFENGDLAAFCETSKMISNSNLDALLRISSRPSMLSTSDNFTSTAASCHHIELPDIDSNTFEHKNDSPMLKILLVDDSASIRKMTKLMLSKLPTYDQVVEASNGADALKLIESGYLNPTSTFFDVILMDLQMPIMDGMEAIRRIRAFEATTGMPKQTIIAMSANEDADTINEALQLGANFFLSKPFKVAEFQQIVLQSSSYSRR